MRIPVASVALKHALPNIAFRSADAVRESRADIGVFVVLATRLNAEVAWCRVPERSCHLLARRFKAVGSGISLLSGAGFSLGPIGAVWGLHKPTFAPSPVYSSSHLPDGQIALIPAINLCGSPEGSSHSTISFVDSADSQNVARESESRYAIVWCGSLRRTGACDHPT